METTNVNAIMEQLEKSDGNVYQSKNNINNFIPLYESDYEEGNNYSKKPNTPIIVLREEYKGRRNNKVQNKVNGKYGNNQERKTTAKMCMTLIVTMN